MSNQVVFRRQDQADLPAPNLRSPNALYFTMDKGNIYIGEVTFLEKSEGISLADLNDSNLMAQREKQIPKTSEVLDLLKRVQDSVAEDAMAWKGQVTPDTLADGNGMKGDTYQLRVAPNTAYSLIDFLFRRVDERTGDITEVNHLTNGMIVVRARTAPLDGKIVYDVIFEDTPGDMRWRGVAYITAVRDGFYQRGDVYFIPQNADLGGGVKVKSGSLIVCNGNRLSADDPISNEFFTILAEPTDMPEIPDQTLYWQTF